MSRTEPEDRHRFYLEKAMLNGMAFRSQHDLALGNSLISPQRSENRADIYHFMRALQPGDVVLHLVNNEAIIGSSIVSSTYEDYRMGSEVWYRVPLRNYRELTPPLHRRAFLSGAAGEDLARIANLGQTNLFYTRYLKLAQGKYLTPLPPPVLSVLKRAYELQTGNVLHLDDVTSNKSRGLG